MKIRKIYLLAIASLVLASCQKSLMVDPESTLTQDDIKEIVKRDPDKVLNPLVTNLVEQVNNYTYSNSVDTRNYSVNNLLLSLKGNDMVLANSTSWLKGDYEMRAYREENSPRTQIYWGTFYRYIFQANQILSVIPEIDESVLSTTNKSIMRYKATALAMRSFAYTNLMWLYQDDYLHGGKDKLGVPIVDPSGDPQPRATSAQVWDLIIKDAELSVNLFKKIGNYKTESRTDVDGSVASAFLVRAQLTMGNWDKAISAADDILAVYSDLFNEADYTTVGMTLLTKEAIFGYAYSSITGKGTSSFYGWMNIKSEGGYGGSQGHWMAIDQHLFDQIPNSDYRKKNFVNLDFIEYTYPTSGAKVKFEKYYNLKFAAPKISAAIPEYNQNEIYIRASEIILAKAEAQARGNKDGDAQTTLFNLVSKRDPSYVKSAKTGAGLLDEIKLQRRIELWGEGGMEFYDNKRWNVGVDRTSSANHQFKNVVLPGKEFTLQIPLNTELNYNDLIQEQNP
ncbi:RagB/SusD family nutrient uptake outer membrane protein [Pedobacter hiemivivus]|uniref:RagB/SusD family nutrient uptake outer membrane protein n=1 Tax=Pedobacter hiemivivus TaxID=2530454 RepID=A0A4U1G322_9SPHI|nr:RagB/SusD family nutrient uptake outer membrane protein [Pedobacter hiemivivus]TKC57199.1 RagB/SusD family nutrient uptake outer membrane protein [Pedobacter hiemivivus]